MLDPPTHPRRNRRSRRWTQIPPAHASVSVAFSVPVSVSVPVIVLVLVLVIVIDRRNA